MELMRDGRIGNAWHDDEEFAIDDPCAAFPCFRTNLRGLRHPTPRVPARANVLLDLGSSIKGGSLPLAVVCTAQLDGGFSRRAASPCPDVVPLALTIVIATTVAIERT